jgi:predicted metal-binding membrane protein
MFLGGWALMIAVGMLPGTLPVTRLVALTRGVPDAAVFVAGYVVVWLAVGVAGFLALAPLAPTVRWGGAGALLAATAAYELTPLLAAVVTWL